MEGRTDPGHARQVHIEQIASWWHAVRLHVPLWCTRGVMAYYLTCWHVAEAVHGAMGWVIAMRHAEHCLCDGEEWGRRRECCAEITVGECGRRQRLVDVQCIHGVDGIT